MSRRQLAQRRIVRDISALFESMRAILSPSVSSVRPASNPLWSDDGGAGEMQCRGICNLTGLEALSLLGGLPPGDFRAELQIVNPRRADDLAPSISSSIE